MTKKVLLIFSSADYEPRYALSAGLSVDKAMGSLFAEVLSGKKNNIHKWIKGSWKNGHEVMAHCYYDQLNEEEVLFYIKKTTKELGLNKSTKTSEQKDSFITCGIILELNIQFNSEHHLLKQLFA